MICTFCGSLACGFSFCANCANQLSVHLGRKLRFQNLRDLNSAVLSDVDDTVDICFDLLFPAR